MEDAGVTAIAQEVIQQEPVEAVAQQPEAPKETKEEPKQEPQEKRLTGYNRVKTQVAQLKAELAELKAQQPKQVPVEIKRPTWEEYEKAGKSTEQYFEDLASHKADEKIKETLAKNDERQKQESWKAEQTKRQTEFQTRAKEFAKQTPDFYEITQENDIDMSPSLAQALLESDKGPELAYYLAKNLEEADEVNQMPYGQAARYLGKLEAKIDTPKVVKTTNASAPINPVGSQARGQFNPQTCDDIDAYRKWRETE